MINGKQFLISRKRHGFSGFLTVGLPDGFFLEYQKDLQAYIHPQKTFLLLGIAWQTDQRRDTPVREMEKLADKYRGQIPEEEIFRMEESWCGRYVLIVQRKVYLDAVGLMGVFYSKEGFSNSCRLLASATGLPERLYDPGTSFYWIPAPLTHYKEIRRLLPDQIYCYHDGSIDARQLLALDYSWMEETDLVRAFADCFAHSLRNMEKMFPDRKIFIALTGGYDSRALLALAVYAQIHFQCCTLEWDGMPECDRTLPAELCEKVGCGFHFIARDKDQFSQNRQEEYQEHTMGLIADQDKTFYTYGQYQELEKQFGDVILLRGSVWEAAAEYYRKYISGEFRPVQMRSVYPAWDTPLIEDALQEYRAWSEKNPQEGLSDRNRFYWEQRSGCWLASIEQAFDLCEHLVSLQPLNCRRMITALLEFSEEERMLKRHEKKITAFACPVLTEVPYGDQMRSRKTDSLRRYLKNAARRIRVLGLKESVLLYKRLAAVKISEKKAGKKSWRKNRSE